MTEPEIEVFEKNINYIIKTSRKTGCSQCNMVLPSNSLCYLRIRQEREERLCKDCGAIVLMMYEDPFSLTPEQMLYKKIRISVPEYRNAWMIFNAVTHNSIEHAKKAIDEAPETLDLKNLSGEPPIVIASYMSCFDIVEMLIDAGVEPQSSSDSGETPLYWASRRGHKNIVRLLIAKGIDINCKNKNGLTPLHAACFKRNLPIIRILVDAGANINIRDEKQKTPLAWANASSEIDLDIISYLKENKAHL